MPITTYYLLPCYRSVTIYPAFGAGPFWGNNKCRRFSRIHSRAVYCAQTYSAKLFMSPPTGAVCHWRSGMQKDEKGAGKLFIVRTGARRGAVRRRAAPFTSPLSVMQTNVRAVQISLPSLVKLLSMEEWWGVCGGGWGGLCCVIHPVSAEVMGGCPITGWDKIRGQFSYASVKREGDYIFFFLQDWEPVNTGVALLIGTSCCLAPVGGDIDDHCLTTTVWSIQKWATTDVRLQRDARRSDIIGYWFDLGANCCILYHLIQFNFRL